MPTPLPPLPSTVAGAMGRPFRNEGRAPIELAHLLRNPVSLAAGEGRRVVITTGLLAGAATAGVVECQAGLDEHAESREITCSHTGRIASVASFRAIAEVLAR